jgi:HEAT repeat protein
MKRFKLVLIAPVVALAGVIVWQVWPTSEPEPEPIYNGKRLSELLRFTWSSGPSGQVLIGGNYEDIEKAVSQIGTNAIPTLLRWSSARSHESTLKLKFMSLFLRQNLIKVHSASGAGWNYAATCGFRALGTNAQNAVPTLIQIANGNPAAFRSDAILSLGYIGPAAEAAVPSLLQLTGNTNWYIRLLSFVSLGRIHSRDEEVIPVLLNGLQDTNQRVQRSAADAFGGFGSSATSAVPQLLRMLNAIPSASSNSCVIWALGAIGPPAKEAVPTLLRWTTNADSQMQSAARTAVLNIDPDTAAKAGITNSVP